MKMSSLNEKCPHFMKMSSLYENIVAFLNLLFHHLHTVSWMFYFCRRGSNLSLLLDVSSLGSEPVCSVSTPKEVWLQLLHTSSRPLTHTMLQQAARDTNTLNVEYQVTTTGLMFVLSENVQEHLMFLNAPV